MVHKKKPKNIVYFEEDIVKKERADSILNDLKAIEKNAQITKQADKYDANIISENHKKKKKEKKLNNEVQREHSQSENGHKEEIVKMNKKKNRKKCIEDLGAEQIIEHDTKEKIKKKSKTQDSNETAKASKKKKIEKILEIDNEEIESDTDAVTTEQKDNQSEQTTGKKTESNRSLKRKKHAKLIEAKKLKTDVKMQESVMNYLSKWKHVKSEWKFEKLKQIWLQQNLFVVCKIPEEFWITAVEYFSGSKGAIRKVIMDKAVKIIEESDEAEEENDDEEYQTRLKRAKDVVQSL